MQLSRIASINNYRIFRNFSWPTGLPAFSKVNVIYGWNGSGKTSISSLLACLQDKKSPDTGYFSLIFDNNTKVDSSDISISEYPSVRVFNRDFIEKTIISIPDGKMTPIFYLGEESTLLKSEIGKLQVELEETNKRNKNAISDLQIAKNDFDVFTINNAKIIKESLIGSSIYANYNKGNFKNTIDLINKSTDRPVQLTDERKNELHTKRQIKQKPDIVELSISMPNIHDFRPKVRKILNQSITSQVIDSLANNQTVSNWVQQGLNLHTKNDNHVECLFCGNTLSPTRIIELEAHFNDAYTKFQEEILQSMEYVKNSIVNLEQIIFPDPSRFYSHIEENAKNAIVEIKEAISQVKNVLNIFCSDLELKKSSPFLSQVAQDDQDMVAENTGALTSSNRLERAIISMNALIKQHNEISKNMQAEINDACKRLEVNFALEALPKYHILLEDIDRKNVAVESIKNMPTVIQSKITEIESKITEHRRPTDELNAELAAYLGRNDLQFEFQETGYSLKRNGNTAHHLSEGERTAVAFLYFLKMLSDKDFNRQSGIVVIDDPVSSLDSNSLFSAFAYMKERTKDCNQLFILTHNFSFFRQVKNWVHHMEHQKKKDKSRRPGRFYSLVSIIDSEGRNATLEELDNLLEEFESEYHYLFKTLYGIINIDDFKRSLSKYYSIPNMARRLMEMFFAHNLPYREDLHGKLDMIDFDSAKKTQIDRLLNTYSHAGGISAPEHDPLILTETCQAVRNIFELIEFCDKGHYQIMCEQVCPILSDVEVS